MTATSQFKLYDELGIQKGASVDEIKKAYRRSAMKYHPDKGGDEKKFKSISNAYEILSDDNKRAQYDQMGDDNFQNMMNAGGGGGGGGGFPPGGMSAHDIFAQMFAGMGGMGGMNFDMGGGMRQKRRQDHSHGIRISLQEAYQGVHKTIQISLKKTCMSCKETCHACQGKGQITNMVRAGPFTQVIQSPCNYCGASGSISRGKESCKECKGKGSYNEEKRIDIDISAGIISGKQIRIEGMGEQRQQADETPGDLILQVQINDHILFTREGNDLKYYALLTFKESIIGKTFTIDHFSGPIEVNTRDFGVIQVAKKYEIRDKGMPIDAAKTRFGNLIIQFDISYPSAPLDSNAIAVLEGALNTLNL